MLFPFPIKKQHPLVTEGHSWKDAGVLPTVNLDLMDGAERAGWSLPCQQGQHSVHEGAEAEGQAAEQSTLEGLEGCLSDVRFVVLHLGSVVFTLTCKRKGGK